MSDLQECSVSEYPNVCRVTFRIFETASVAGLSADSALILGQIGDGATAVPGQIYEVDQDTREELFGPNSMLNVMIDNFTARVPQYAMALPNSGTASVYTGTVSGVDTATTSGRIYLFVNGNSYSVAYESGETNTAVAERLADYIAGFEPTLNVSFSGDDVIIETKALGAVGGDLNVLSSYRWRGSDITTGGASITGSVVKGTGGPLLSDYNFATLPDPYRFVISPYTDETNLLELRAYLCGQWDGGGNSTGHGVFLSDPLSAAESTAANIDSSLLNFMGGLEGYQTPSYIMSAAYGSVVARRFNNEAAPLSAPLNGEPLRSIRPPEQPETLAEKDSLAGNGLGYFNVDQTTGAVSIGRSVTMRFTGPTGSPLAGPEDANYPAMVSYVTRYISNQLEQKYSGFGFRSDNVVGPVGSARIATVEGVRSYIIGLLQDLSNQNVIQNVGDIQPIIEQGDECLLIDLGEPDFVDPFCCAKISATFGG